MQLASYAMRKQVATIKGVSGDFDPNNWRANKDARKASKASKAKQEKESGRDDNLTPRSVPPHALP
jgi:hypothetical protein